MEKGDVLQGGIFTDPADPADPEAYLSQKTADIKTGDADPDGGSAVPERGYTRVTGENLNEYLRELKGEPDRITGPCTWEDDGLTIHYRPEAGE